MHKVKENLNPDFLFSFKDTCYDDIINEAVDLCYQTIEVKTMTF